MANLNQFCRSFYLLTFAILLTLNSPGKSESEIDSIVHILQQASKNRDFNQCKQPDTSFAIRIETQNGCAFPGDTIKLAVSFKSPPFMIWAFDLLMAYDTSLLSFQKAEPGPEFFTESGCAWEYFAFRGGDNPSCQPGDCLKGKVRVVGVSDVNICCATPNCWYSEKIADLFYLVFVVKNSNHLYTTAPVQFYWRDCLDNAIFFLSENDPTYGSVEQVAMTGRVFESGELLIPQDTFPTYLGPPDSCISSGFTHNYPVRKMIDLYNGGVAVVGYSCPDGFDVRGDVNLNGVSNEINDFILFAKYFLYGTSVFTINIAGQIYASDINKDDESLKLEDLIQLGRVVFGDLPEDWIFDSTLAGNNFVLNNESNHSVHFQTEQCSNIIWLKFEGEVSPHFGNHQYFVLHHFDGEFTNVLAISLRGFNVGFHTLFEYFGQGLLTDAQAATLEGYEIALGPVGLLTDVDETKGHLPSEFQVRQNYPNPFNNSTVISFDIPRAGNVELEIINLLGQTVYRFEKRYSAGSYSISWDGVDNAGRTVGSGVYYYRIVAGDFVASKKMILLK